MKFRKMTSLVLVLLLAMAMPVQALADTYYLEDGSVEVKAEETETGTTQTVHQFRIGTDDIVKEDTSPVITQRDSSQTTNKSIYIQSEGDATANLTIQDVHISKEGTGIYVMEDSSANITVQGTNTVTDTSGWQAPIQFTTGDLTLSGGEGASLTAEAQEDSRAAAIGGASNSGFTSMEGNLTIKGDGLSVTASSQYGAGIGSAYDAGMSGTITIEGNAHVQASSQYGAGIGAGGWGSMSGTVAIGGNAEVTASSQGGAAIGAGYAGYGTDGTFEEGASITIGGTAQVTVNKTDADGNVLPNEKGVIGSVASDKANGTVAIESSAKLNGESVTEASQLSAYGLSEDKVAVTVVPEPTEPEPTEPQPTEPQPTEPQPTEPQPTEPQPTEPQPTEPQPTEPKPTEPKPTEPQPAEPVAPETAESSEPQEPEQSQPIPTAPSYRAVDRNGKKLEQTASLKDGTLTVTVEEDEAFFLADRAALLELQRQGVKTVVFATAGKTSQFDVAQALAALPSGKLVLTHTGTAATLTLDGVEAGNLLQ